MKSLRVLYHMLRADFLERTRRYSFLVTLGLTIAMAYAYVPPRDAWYITLSVDAARGVYNSAWLGSLVAILTSMTLWFAGFYLVKNAVARDAETGVGQIIATTPLRRPLYTLGKWLSNFAVLLSMVGVTAVAAGVLQLVRGEERHIDLVALLAPFAFVVLPAMAVVAALAVLFETVGFLRRGLGNIVYFFLSIALFAGTVLPAMLSAGGLAVPPSLLAASSAADILGVGFPLRNMLDATTAAFPNLDIGNNGIGPVPRFGPVQTFVWEGVPWTPAMIGARLIWVGVAFAIALFAALFFSRFDPAREGHRPATNDQQPTITTKQQPSGAELPPVPALPVALSPALRTRFTFGRVLLAELRLLRKGLRWWWYLVAAVLVVAGLLIPAGLARQYLLPITWLWPILLWSGLGAREGRYHTAPLVFSAAHPLGRQLPATWLAGVLVTALTGSGVAANLLLAGEGMGLLAWGVAALFIPTLALALAVWSGGSKLFEVVYMVLWYAGPMNKILPQLDFMGASSKATAAGMPLVYLLATLALLGVAVVGRRRQVQG